VKTQTKADVQTFVVDLPGPVHRKLQDRSIRESRRSGRKVPMTEIARRAIERELKSPIAAE
jgi:hypothetical protein